MFADFLGDTLHTLSTFFVFVLEVKGEAASAFMEIRVRKYFRGEFACIHNHILNSR
jgi:hypothetical protein